MPDFVRDHQSARARLPDIFCENRAALFVENRAGAFQCRVTGREPCQFQVQVSKGGVHELHWLLARRSCVGKLEMEPGRYITNVFERLHKSISKGQ